MKLDDSLATKSASLDVTPLIDVVFLLVIFFAVTTSFINPEELQLLQRTLSSLVVDQSTLQQQLAAEQDKSTALNSELSDTRASLSDLRDQQTATLAKLSASLDESQNLRQQQGQTQAELEANRDQAQRLQDQQKQTLAELKVSRDQAQRLQDEQAQALAKLQTNDNELQRLLDRQTLTLADLQSSRDEVLRLQDSQTQTLAELENSRDQAQSLQNQQTQTQAELTDSREQAEQLREQLAAAVQASAELQSERDVLAEENQRFQALAQSSRDDIERAIDAEQSLNQSLQTLRDGTVNVERRRDQLIINLSNQILFDSGSSDLKPQGLEVLRQVGELYNSEFPDFDLRVGGHTDNVPVSGRGRFANNWALSAARAVNVVSFLEDAANIPGTRLAALGYGEHRPLAANESAAQRAENRRIELVLVPKSKAQP